jgi:hypothetical protein
MSITSRPTSAAVRCSAGSAPRLEGWRTHTFQAMTRRGPATEWLWTNYPEPTALHDYRFLGDNYRERERIKRKIGRWTARLWGMDLLERRALLAALQTVESGDHHHSPGMAIPPGAEKEAAYTAGPADGRRHVPTEPAATAAEQ